MAGTQIPPLPAGAEQPDVDLLLRMSADLRRALAKPLNERRWVMVIDLRKCIGCHACTVSCIAENKLPPGVVYRPVLEEEVGSYPHLSKIFTPRPCMQCDNPPCVPVCPVEATIKRPDGIVDFGEFYTSDTPGGVQAYEKAPTFEYGKKRVREHEDSPIGNARKCHFCVHKLEEGMLPSCTSACIGRATFFGDANDAESLVHELIGKPNVRTLKPEAGTKPRVYYLIYGGAHEMKATKYILGALWAIAFVLGLVGIYQRLTNGHMLAGYGSYVVWGLWVAAYAYFMGLSAGSFLFAALVNVLNVQELKPLTRAALWTSFVSIAVAMMGVVLDLGHMGRAFSLFFRPNLSSMMAWMGILYAVFGLLLVALAWFIYK